MPTLYILCGLPFSGKTVLAKQLTDKLGFAVVGIDAIRENRGFSWEDNEKVTTEDWQSIFQESYDRTLALLARGKSIIYDSANQDRISRDRLRALAAKGGYPTRVIFMDVPEREVRGRWLQNQKSGQRFHLPEKWFQAAIDTFEPPTADENVIRYNQRMDFEKWVQEHFTTEK